MVISVAVTWVQRNQKSSAGRPQPITQNSLAGASPTSKAQPAPDSSTPAQRQQPHRASVAVPESLRLIVHPEGEAGYGERVTAVRSIRRNLTTEEIHAFYGYLLGPAPADAADREQENWLRNVMMDKLVEQPTVPADLPEVLISIFQDHAQDVVMRDYAVQHLNPIYGQAAAETKAAIRQALWQAAGETDTSIAGTALLALNDLAQNNAEFDRNQIQQTALKLADDGQCGELARITAVQICAQMGVTQAAASVLQLAQSATSIPLRITAIAALGDLGGAAVVPYLREIAEGDEDRLKPAAESALKRLKKRLGT